MNAGEERQWQEGDRFGPGSHCRPSYHSYRTP